MPGIVSVESLKEIFSSSNTLQVKSEIVTKIFFSECSQSNPFQLTLEGWMQFSWNALQFMRMRKKVLPKKEQRTVS